MYCIHNPSFQQSNLVGLETIVETILHTRIMTTRQEAQVSAMVSGWQLTPVEEKALQRLMDALYRQKVETGKRFYLDIVA